MWTWTMSMGWNWLEGFEADVAVFDFHRRADVDLDADEAVEAAVFRVVVDDDAHDVAVDDVGEDVAADDEVIGVPVFAFNVGGEGGGIAERGEELGLAGFADADHLAAVGEESAAAFLVVLADPTFDVVDVGLIAGERPGCIRKLDTAVVDAAVAAGGDAVIELELEVGGSAAAPDDEGVSFDEGFGGDFPDEVAVFDAPVFGIAVPVGEGASVEDGNETGVVGGRDDGESGGGHGRDEDEEGQDEWK
jgi:hypothetical protein